MKKNVDDEDSEQSSGDSLKSFRYGSEEDI